MPNIRSRYATWSACCIAVSLDRVHATVDDQLGAGDEARFVRYQVKDAISDVLGRAEFAQRDAAQRALARLVVGHHRIPHWRQDDAGMDRIAAHFITLARAIDRHRLGELPHRALAGAIG